MATAGVADHRVYVLTKAPKLDPSFRAGDAPSDLSAAYLVLSQRELEPAAGDRVRILEVATINSSREAAPGTVYARVRSVSGGEVDSGEGWVRRSHLAIVEEQRSASFPPDPLVCAPLRNDRVQPLVTRLQAQGSITVGEAIALYGCSGRSARSNLLAVVRHNLPGARLVQVAERAGRDDVVRNRQTRACFRLSRLVRHHLSSSTR